MGQSILNNYRIHVKPSWKTAFFSAFIATLLIHLYKFTNALPNHDSLFSVYSTLDATASGRWFLAIAGSFSSAFDLPWVNGLLSALYLGIVAIFVTELFKMTNAVVILLSSILLAASPCTTETFFYEFTADAFFFGLMLATIGSYLCITGSKRTPKKLAVGCILLCLSCGIYQAYISFAILLFICYLIVQLLDGNLSVKEGWLQICKQVLLYGISLACYYTVWQVILALTGQVASSYQGIDSVGQVSISTLLGGLVSSVVNLLRWFFGGNLLKNPLTLYSILHYLLILSLIRIVVIALIRSNSARTPGKVFLVLFALIFCIPVISIWNFVSASLVYRPMMMHSVMVLLILSILLFDRWAPHKISTIFAIVMAINIFNYGLLANIAYAEMDLTSKRSHATATQLMQTIYSCEEVNSIAFIGSRQESLYIGQTYPGNMGYPLTSGLEKDLLYDHSHAYLYLSQYMGMDIPSATNIEIETLQNNPMVQSLPTWPSQGYAIVIDGILVIKLSD